MSGETLVWDALASPEEIALMMEAGFIYRYSKRFHEAREIFRGVRALRPRNEVPEIALGTVSFEEGDFRAAIRHYTKAIALNPRSAYAYAHLGEALLFRKEEENARISLERALELDPNGEFGNLAGTLLAYLGSGRRE